MTSFGAVSPFFVVSPVVFLRFCRIFRPTVVTILALLLAPFLVAQFPSPVNNDTRTPLPGSGHDYINMLNETVDPSNGSLSVHISTPVPPSRRLTMPFSFDYSSGAVMQAQEGNAGWASWAVTTIFGAVINSGGWSYRIPELTANQPNVICYINGGGGRTLTTQISLSYIFTDPSGTRHNLGLAHVPTLNPDCTYLQDLYSVSTGGDDFYGASLNQTSGAVTVVGVDGTVYNFSGASFGLNYGVNAWLPSTIEDRNGNIARISEGSGGSITETDTAGRSAVSTSAPAGTNGTVSVSGLSNAYTVTWETMVFGYGSQYEQIGNGPPACNWSTSGGGSGGVIKSIELPNQEYYDFAYDSYGFHLHVAISTTNCSFSAYPSGDNGNVFQILNKFDPTRSAAFTYDSLNRISQANTTNTTSSNCWGEAYTIDAWGNLTNIAGAPGVGGNCFTESLNTGAATTANQLNGFCYDAAGNLLLNSSCPSGSFTPTYYYDSENRLYNPEAEYTYFYDADGVRIRKAASATVGTMYWPGPNGEYLMETNGSGTINEEYIYFNGARIARVDRPSGTVHYYFSNHLGSASVITDALGNIEQQTDYYPFGGVAYTSGSDPNHYRFTGKERDTESGLDEFGARYYSSSMGRFMIPDWSGKPTSVPYASFGNPQSLNLYSYVENNPTTTEDPDGHAGVDCGGLPACNEMGQELRVGECGFAAGGGGACRTGAPLSYYFRNFFAGYSKTLGEVGSMGLASPDTDPEGIAGEAGSYFALAGVLFIPSGGGKAVALDTNALIAAIEHPNSAEGQAVLKAIAGKEVSVSMSAAKEFLAKGDAKLLREFMVANSGHISKAASDTIVQGLISLGLKKTDARIVGAAIQEGIRVLTNDKEILKKIPSVAGPI